MPDHDFSSWPREQEASFVVYERKTSDSAKQALTIGGIVGGLFFIIAIGIYLGVEPKKDNLAKDMDMSNLTKRTDDAAAKTAPKPDKPAETKTESAPAADKPADKPADEAKPESK